MGRRFNLDGKQNTSALDYLLSTEEERQATEYIREIPIDQIRPFENHPFEIRDDDDMKMLEESVERLGILQPILVRPHPDGKGFELVAGHRRRHIALKTELKTIPAIVRELNDDEATILMVDSNVQREKVLPSEKARAYKMRLDAEKRQGHRTDLTSRQVGARSRKESRTDEKIAATSQDSARQILRYIRLNYLTQNYLNAVDNGKLPLIAAVELSYISLEVQEKIYGQFSKDSGIMPSIAQAKELKKHHLAGTLTDSLVDKIFNVRAEKTEMAFKVSSEIARKYFERDATPRQKEQHVIAALDSYQNLTALRQKYFSEKSNKITYSDLWELIDASLENEIKRRQRFSHSQER